MQTLGCQPDLPRKVQSGGDSEQHPPVTHDVGLQPSAPHRRSLSPTPRSGRASPGPGIRRSADSLLARPARQPPPLSGPRCPADTVCQAAGAAQRDQRGPPRPPSRCAPVQTPLTMSARAGSRWRRGASWAERTGQLRGGACSGRPQLMINSG